MRVGNGIKAVNNVFVLSDNAPNLWGIAQAPVTYCALSVPQFTLSPLPVFSLASLNYRFLIPHSTLLPAHSVFIIFIAFLRRMD